MTETRSKSEYLRFCLLIERQLESDDVTGFEVHKVNFQPGKSRNPHSVGRQIRSGLDPDISFLGPNPPKATHWAVETYPICAMMGVRGVTRARSSTRSLTLQLCRD